MSEWTFAMIKPDSVRHSLTSRIITQLEEAGLVLEYLG